MSPGSAARPAVTVGRKGYFRSFVAEEIRPTNVPFRTSQDSRAGRNMHVDVEPAVTELSRPTRGHWSTSYHRPV